MTRVTTACGETYVYGPDERVFALVNEDPGWYFEHVSPGSLATGEWFMLPGTRPGFAPELRRVARVERMNVA